MQVLSAWGEAVKKIIPEDNWTGSSTFTPGPSGCINNEYS